MEALNEQIVSLLMDSGLEGVGASAGIGLLWGCFFHGSYELFGRLLELLASTI